MIPLRFYFPGPCPFPLCTTWQAHSHRNLLAATAAELLQALTASIAATQAQRTDPRDTAAWDDLSPSDRREFFPRRYKPSTMKGAPNA